MILTCEQCNTRYLVPQHAIGADGRTVRCTSCQHEWFQEPEDSGAPPEVFEVPEDIDPIPDSVLPIPEDSGLPAIREDIMTEGAREPRVPHPRAMGYAAAAAVFVLIAGGLYVLHEPVAKIWPPAARLYEVAGLTTQLPGEGLVFDRVNATVTADGTGAKTLNIEGMIVNLKSFPIDILPIQTSLVMADGSVFDSWQLELPENVAPAGADVPFKTSYPEVPKDVKEVTVSFRAAAHTKLLAPAVEKETAVHEDKSAPAPQGTPHGAEAPAGQPEH